MTRPGAATAAITDGRRRKGLRRRALLVEATMQVIARDGVAALSQRAVARYAGVPPSAVTYYFPTIDDLLVAALTWCNDDYLHRLAEIGAAGDRRPVLAGLAELITEGATARRAEVAAEYELFLLAARRADLRDELTRWTDAVDALLAPIVTDPVRRAGLTAAVDGLFLHAFCAPHPPDAATVLEVLEALAAPAPSTATRGTLGQ